MTARLLFLLLICLLLTVLRAAPPAAMQLRRLRCELLANLEGIDFTAPRLSWELGSSGGHQKVWGNRVRWPSAFPAASTGALPFQRALIRD